MRKIGLNYLPGGGMNYRIYQDFKQENDQKEFMDTLKYMKSYPLFFNKILLKKVPKVQKKGHQSKITVHVRPDVLDKEFPNF